MSTTATNQPTLDQQPNQQATGIQVTTTEKTVEQVLEKIASFTNTGMRLPKNYSAENAVRAAWLIIQGVKDMSDRPALTVCTRESIASAMFEMVQQGLNPVKKQCYFIVYGNQLTMQRSYKGTIAIGKRVANVKEVRGVPLYEGDKFKYEVDTTTGRKKILLHETDFNNIDPEKVMGAYAIVTEKDGATWAEVMNMKQIKNSWSMGKTKGDSKAHRLFPDEMACKTVIARALKIEIDSSDDSDLFDIGEEYEEELQTDQASAAVAQEISDNANKKELNFDEHEELEDEQEPSGLLKQETEEPNAETVNQGPGF